MATQRQREARGPLTRLPGADLATAEAVFKAAMLLMVPDDQTQRKAFELLMPYLYVLRNKGCSWAQLTKLLSDCGFRLQPSSVRTYYGEMLATRQDICQERMNEQILLMAEVRKETKGADMSAIAGRVAAIMGKQREMDETKLDAIYGAAAPAHTPVPVETALPSREDKKKPGLRPALENQTPAPADSSDSFGLLNMTNAEKKPSKPPSFFSQDDDGPVIPVLRKHAPRAATPQPPVVKAVPKPQFRCLALQDGIQPLKRRDQVPPEIYLAGDMEHPAIPGLMLSLPQRLYGAALELANTDDGEIQIETADEKRFRVLWRHPIPMTESMTGSSFTKIDESLFLKR